MPFARFESSTTSLRSSSSPPFDQCRRSWRRSEERRLDRRTVSGLPGSRLRPGHPPPRSKERNRTISARVELPRPPSRASDPPSISEEKLDESSTPSGALYGLVHGLRAHITAPKSSSVNPTHLQSPKRLSVSSSSLRGPERPLDKPPIARDRAPKNPSTSTRTSAYKSSETLVFNPRLHRQVPKNLLAKPPLEFERSGVPVSVA